MITAPNDFISAVQSDARTFYAKILQDNALVDCDIRSITIDKKAFGDMEFTVGSVTASQIEIVADGISHALENKDIQVVLGIRTGDDGNLLDQDGNKILTSDGKTLSYDNIRYISLGYFTATKIRETTMQTTLTGVGFIASKLGDDFVPPETQTLAEIAAAIEAISGVPVSFEDGIDSSGEITRQLTGLTCRDALEIITGVTGGFATENSTGGIEIHKYQISENPLTVDADMVLTPPTLAENDFVMTGVAVSGANGNFTYGDPRQIYSNDYMTNDLFTGFATNIVGYTFRAGDVPVAKGDPRLEPWDTLLVKDLDNTAYNVPCHQITIHYDGGIYLDVSAVGETVSEVEVRTPMMKRIDELQDVIDNLGVQIDGKIETWAKDEPPSIGWPSDELEAHNGDLWLYTGTVAFVLDELTIHPQGVYVYIYDSATGTGTWQEYSSTTDNLFDLANGKATVYYGAYPFTSVTDMHDTDLAIDNTTKKLYRYDAASKTWVEVDNYTSAITALRTDLEGQIDEKIQTYRQSADPSLEWAEADYDKHTGDLWQYTGPSTFVLTENATYRWSGEEWAECEVSQEVFDEIDGKTTIWYGSPTSTYDANAGDFLVDSSSGCTYRWSGSAWILETDYMTPLTAHVALETTYSVVDGYAYFNAYVYAAGLPVTENYPDSLFKWYRKTEDYTNYPSGKIPLGTGKSLTVDLDDMVYGGVIRCEFNYQVDAYLLDSSGNNLVTSSGDSIVAKA